MQRGLLRDAQLARMHQHADVDAMVAKVSMACLAHGPEWKDAHERGLERLMWQSNCVRLAQIHL